MIQMKHMLIQMFQKILLQQLMRPILFVKKKK
jgi:hypothetical protein